MWLFSSKKTVSKTKLTSVRKTYVSKSVKILDFGKESKRKKLNVISAGSLLKNNNVCDLKVEISFMY